MTERRSHAFAVLLATSFALHLAFVEAMPTAGATAPSPPTPTPITISIVDPPRRLPPPPPSPPLEPSPETAPTRPASRAAPPVARRRVSRPVAAAEPPRAAEPMELSGVTLSNEGATWSIPAGTGELAPAAPTPASSRGRGGSARDQVVAVGDLSRAPRAPDLDAALAANYPQDARRAGVTGKAMVRARILADGTVGMIRVVSETAAGFGAACRRTLAGSRWQAPLDARREAVATDINYTCTFAVAR